MDFSDARKYGSMHLTDMGPLTNPGGFLTPQHITMAGGWFGPATSPRRQGGSRSITVTDTRKCGYTGMVRD